MCKGVRCQLREVRGPYPARNAEVGDLSVPVLVRAEVRGPYCVRRAVYLMTARGPVLKERRRSGDLIRQEALLSVDLTVQGVRS